MAIFNRTFIFLSESLFKKSKPSSQEYKYAGKFTVTEVSSSNKSLFEKLYNNEVLTAEGIQISNAGLEAVNKWFRENSNCNASNIDMYIILGKDMNNFYHLTGDNKYQDDMHILGIDWLSANCKNVYKGSWRWFSDIVDNNAKREIAKKNPYYKHFVSIYYGDIGWEAK